VAVGGVAFSVLGWLVLTGHERSMIEGEYEREAQNVVRLVELEFATVEETVLALTSFFAASKDVSFSEFTKFTDGLTLDEHHDEIRAFYYATCDGDDVVVQYASGADPADSGFVLGKRADFATILEVEDPPSFGALPMDNRSVLVFGAARSTDGDQIGVIAVLVRIPYIVNRAKTRFDANAMAMHLQLLRGKTSLFGEPVSGEPAYEQLLSLGKRTIVVKVAPPDPQYVADRINYYAAWMALCAMLIAMAAAVGYLWTMKNRTARVELLVQERTATIREVTRLQRAILESANYAIIAFDPLGRVLTFNPAAERMLGYKSRDVIGQMSPVDFHDAADLETRAREMDAPAGLEVICRLAGQGDAVGWRYRRADGSTLPVSLSVSALHDEDGEIVGFLAIAHDITTRLHAEAELREAKAQAEGASRTKSQFLANMSHELRTPLTAILGYSEMLMDDAKENGAKGLADDLERIHRAGKHLLRLIDDVLDLSKVEAGRILLHPEQVDVRALIDDVVATVLPLAESRGNVLEVSCTATSLFADPTRLKQVLFNLMANAARFTENGTIEMEARDDGDDVEFRVRDTGIGMSREDLACVFEPFVQADGTSTRRFGGTGLGLAIARQFAERMDGSITVTSEPGAGSDFRMRVPAGRS